ncbi:DUF262 domain-containing protein [Streptomyces sp. NPDC093071]|uniref:GmrSD restriction endonuclease domain-containing protein n=1 Tax=Streptomyces sp. NPDC093071 TaxID=3366022 RepID=UPI0038136E5E
MYKPQAHGGIELDDQPSEFNCPNCQAGKDHFHLFIPPTDDVTAPEEKEEGDAIDPMGSRLLYTKFGSPDVATLHRQYQRSKLDPQPFFQRYEVWTAQKNSKLIESILLDLPIPQIYLAQQENESVDVIDGQQRLMAIFKYLRGDYRLKGVTKYLEGKAFSDLPEGLQDRIESYELHTVTILKESDPEVKFMLFQRLNEGSTSLNDQELRNSVHRGTYNEFLKKLAGEQDWRKILNLKGTKPHARMVDVELVLRFMAFRDQKYLNHPDKKTSKFLDKQMTLGATLDEKERLKAQADFKQAIELSRLVFGGQASRRFIAGSDENPQGKWDSRINRALMDVQLQGFLRYPKGQYVANADALREGAIELMSTPEFADLTTHTISEAKRIERRFDLWKEYIDRTLADSGQGSRLFSRQLKEELWNESQECVICKQKIRDIDDAHVDHVVPYSDGGRTDKSNAALTHRFCNLSKGRRGAASS